MIPIKDPSCNIDRQSTFLFECGRCSECCSDKKIQVNPYEIARLAAHLKISTTEFIQSFTSDGVYLSNRSDGQCVFLGSDGCRVHRDRPLVCRLYPLGRNLSAAGDESFIFSISHPKCQGTSTKSQTVEDYLKAQGANVFLEAAEAYRALLGKIVKALDHEKEFPLPEWINVTHGSDLGTSFPRLLDPDWVIDNDDCAKITAGLDPWEKMMHHIGVVEKWLNNHNQ